MSESESIDDLRRERDLYRNALRVEVSRQEEGMVKFWKDQASESERKRFELAGKVERLRHNVENQRNIIQVLEKRAVKAEAEVERLRDRVHMHVHYLLTEVFPDPDISDFEKWDTARDRLRFLLNVGEKEMGRGEY